MTKASAAKLKYMAEYQKSPENVDKRVERNKARRQAIAAGQAKKGDGTEVDHKKPLDKGGSNDKSNRRVVPASQNRSWRDEHGSMYGKKK